MEAHLLRINSIYPYAHIDDKWVIEDKSFLPKIYNLDTGKEIQWQESKSYYSDIKRAKVTTKDGRKTNISSQVISQAYDERHPDRFTGYIMRNNKPKR